MKIKVMRVGLWYVWLYGFVLIALSFYATLRLPSSFDKPVIFNHRGALTLTFTQVRNPNITIFTAPKVGVDGLLGHKQSLAIRSWLALSPSVNVVLFSQFHSVGSGFGSRVFVDSHIDFTFLGTPFFHSMLERSRMFATDVAVFVDPEAILLQDLISTLNNAYKLDNDWLLVTSLGNVSYFPFHLDSAGKHWIKKDGKRVKHQEEVLGRNCQWNNCEDKLLLAWNNRNLPLHNGVLPPFLFGKGIHNHWVVNEAMSSGERFVFDATWTISGFILNESETLPNQPVGKSGMLNLENKWWEHVGNSYLGVQYGSIFFHEMNFTSLVKLLKCGGEYLLFDITENSVFPFMYQNLSIWNRRMLHSWRHKRRRACVDIAKIVKRSLCCSLRDELKSLPPLDFPFSVESLLLATADENRTVVLTVAGYNYKDMLMSWACRLRRLHVSNFIVCALDHETYEFALLQGLPVFYDPSAPRNISFNDCHFGTKCFQRVTKTKSRMVLKILKLGYNVILSDVDVYWFENPLPMLSSFGPAVLVAQSDEYNITGPINLPRRLNSGFYFARPDPPTIAAIEKVVEHAMASELSEQPSFYDVLCGEGGSNRIGDDRCVEPKTNLTVQFLDRNLFPNGAYLDLWQKKDVKEACLLKGCLILHNNWINGREKKLERQVLSGLWEYDSSKRMCT